MSTASLTLFFQGFPAPQLYAAPGAWERGGCSRAGGRRGILLTLPFSSPGSKWEEAQKEGSRPVFSRPCLFFSCVQQWQDPQGRKLPGGWEAGEAGAGDGAPCSGQVSGSHRKSRRPGLNSFSLPPPSLMQTGLGGNTPGSPWAHKAGFGQGFLTLPCSPKEGSSRSMSLSSRN